MTEHYYTDKPTTASEEYSFDFTLRGSSFRFTSDRGVFSKKEIDFGSRLLIESFVSPIAEGDLLDVGCGYGPIGITLAKENPQSTVYMIDINERALELARKNAVKNGTPNVEIRKSNVFEHVNKVDFAAILTNPPIRAGKEVVHAILEGAKDHMTAGGELWVVIQKKQGAPSAIAKLKQLYSEVEVVTKSKGYFIIRAKKID